MKEGQQLCLILELLTSRTQAQRSFKVYLESFQRNTNKEERLMNERNQHFFYLCPCNEIRADWCDVRTSCAVISHSYTHAHAQTGMFKNLISSAFEIKRNFEKGDDHHTLQHQKYILKLASSFQTNVQ